MSIARNPGVALMRQPLTPHNRWVRRHPPLPGPLLDGYFGFAAERQRVFYARFNRQQPPWTTDAVLQLYKFTNCFRASDRVSQYLIANVLNAKYSEEDAFLRVLLFKFFNRIETWERIVLHLGEVSASSFSATDCSRVLDEALRQNERVYTAAYIMPAVARFAAGRKHESHLALLGAMLANGAPAQIAACRTLEDVFHALRQWPSLGPFLAYQYAIDLNYSSILNCDENEFVEAGPGAKSGLRRCFKSFGDFSDADVIRWVADRQEDEFLRLGLQPVTLFGRALHLIDCQNLFCEFDKYARVAYPNTSPTGRIRIKQRFRPLNTDLPYAFPAGWGLRVPHRPPKETVAGRR
jgi:hypothetical protein